MSSFNKINKNIIKSILVSISFLLIINMIFLKLISNHIVTDFYNSKADDIFKDLEQVVGSLEGSTKRVSQNQDIIDILKNNKSFDDLSQQDIRDMFDEIHLSESLLQHLSFVDTINIASVEGDYLFTQNQVYDNFVIEERSWFTEEYKSKHSEPTIVDVHEDFSTGKQTTSLVSYILDENNDLLGATILDIYIDDLLNYIESRYYVEGLRAYFFIDYVYYPSENIAYDSNHFNVHNDLLLLSFDKSCSLPVKSMDKFLYFIIIMYTLVCVALIYFLSRLIQRLLEPITNCLTKFKQMIKNSNEDIDQLVEKSELEQLEFISNTLSKTFDDTIKQLIYYDELTNLLNKKSLIYITNELISTKSAFALIFIDVVNLKTITDLFGYKLGDQVIKEFSSELSTVSSDDIIVTRYSQSKFIILCKNHTSDEDLKHFYTNNILNKFEIKKFINESIKVNLSASVSIYPNQGSTIDTLLQKNEFMLDINKQQSKNNQLLFFDDEIYKKISRAESIKSNLRNALDKNEFKLLYQPIMDKNEVVQKLEALIRWENSEIGFVSPNEFIKHAEEIGEIVPIGYWIFEEVCKNYKYISLNTPSPLQISINVSPIQLLDDCFFENVVTILNRYMIDSRNICIEVTESVLMETNNSISKNLLNLRNVGFDIALDDFGTGYSSFSYLKQFNFSILKIDKMFINDDNESDYKIVENIINIAKELDIDVVIEGVETKRQLDSLKNANCDFFQGYYFSKPLSFDNLLIYLSLFK